MTRVHLVRHGSAGKKGDWSDDARRPLDEEGRAHALALCRRLADQSIRRLRSSPASRCVDTLAPLAAAAGLPIETLDVLDVDAQPHQLATIVTADALDGDVVCAHGEAMADLLGQLRRQGATIEPELADDELLAKGSCWELHLDGGSITGLRHIALAD